MRRLDGEMLRKDISGRKNPAAMSLGEIVKELVESSSIESMLSSYTCRNENSADIEVLENALQKRTSGLYLELDRREDEYRK